MALKQLRPIKPNRSVQAEIRRTIMAAVSLTQDEITALLRQGTEVDIDALQRSLDLAPWWDNAADRIQGIVSKYDLEHQDQFNKILAEAIGVTTPIQTVGHEKLMASLLSDSTDQLNQIRESLNSGILRKASRGVINGQTTSLLISELRQAFKVSERSARNVAGDVTRKMTGALNRTRQQAAGVKSYKWSTSSDPRVRESHRALNGQIVEWDGAKIINGKDKGKTTSAVIKNAGGDPVSDGIHPQQGYNCRCVAIAQIEVV